MVGDLDVRGADEGVQGGVYSGADEVCFFFEVEVVKHYGGGEDLCEWVCNV